MKKLLLCALLASVSAFAASPAVCYAISNITVATDWTGAGAANHWASSSGGSAGSCTASGGSGLTIRGVTSTLPAGVPGASASGDAIVVNSGITVHVAVGIGIDLATASFPTTGDGFTVNAASLGVYGALRIDNGGVVRTHGASDFTGNQRGTINQFAWFQVMPGGSLWIGNAANGPVFDIGGNFFSGCGDQSAYPSPLCSGNAGGLATVSAAGACPAVGLTTGCFTATTALPAGLTSGNMVEITRPLPIIGTYPYQVYDSVTLPVDPPQLPTTNDTGSVTNNMCGLAASCPVPEGTPLCVISVSGLSVTLGWPRGGTPALPYCTGAETAANITNAGSGSLWLFQPAFIAGDPSVMTWNTPQTHTGLMGVVYGHFDSLRSGAMIQDAPISNAAGTGPGRIGDNSLNFTANNFGAVNNSAISDPCLDRTVQAVLSAGCMLNYDNGNIMAFGDGITFTGNYTYTTTNLESGLVNLAGGIRPRSGVTSSLVIANTDIRNIASAEGFIQFVNTPNPAAFVNNTIHNSIGEVSFGTSVSQTNAASGTAVSPIPVRGNSYFAGPFNTSSYAPNMAHVLFFGSPQYVDISGNLQADYHVMVNCPLNTLGSPIDANIYQLATTSNWTMSDLFFNGGTQQCHWRNALLQNNRITGFGISDAAFVGAPGYLFAIQAIHSDLDSQPVIIRGNMTYGTFRSCELTGNSQWLDNAFIWSHHHVCIMGQPYVQNTVFAGNVIVTNDQSGQTLGGLNLGFAATVYSKGVSIYNNTWVGMNAGCVQIGDTDSSFSIHQGLNIYNNVCAPSGSGFMFAKTPGVSFPSMLSWQSPLIGFNSTQGTTGPVIGVTAPNSNSIPGATYTRNTIPKWHSDFDYNLDQARTVTGFAIENPTYPTALATGALQYTHTSTTNITAAWSANNGANYGTAQQLNWGGSGTTYTVSSTSNPDSEETAITISTTPFVANSIASTVALGSSTPLDREVVMLTGTKTGTVCAITQVTANNTIYCTPQISGGLTGGDTFAIFATDVVLPDAASGSVEVGINWAQVPTSSQADTGITLSFADYCSASTLCIGTQLVSGIPTATGSGSTNLPITPDNLFIPSYRGSAQRVLCSGASGCGGTAYYQSTGTAWITGGLYGSPVGAVGQNPAAIVPQLIPH